MTDSAALRLGDRLVAEYAWRPELPIALAPRPFLHPVRTLAGTVVTEAQPATHRHHLGVGFPVADVGGSNFWGSRTFLPGHGPAWLDNHGTQEHARWIQQRPDRLAHSLRWTAIDHEQLLAERRTIAARRLDAREWALDWESVLTNTAGRTLAIRSPAVLGREGAGFGGFFWRVATAAGDCRVATAAGEGTEAAHGSRSPWLLLAGPAAGTPPWSLVFVGATERTRADRWFVRTRDYVGVGSGLAWDQPLELAAGATLTRRFVVIVADGTLSTGQAAERAAGLAQ